MARCHPGRAADPSTPPAAGIALASGEVVAALGYLDRRAYDQIASLYDRHWHQRFAVAATDAVTRLLDGEAPDPRRLLDVCPRGLPRPLLDLPREHRGRHHRCPGQGRPPPQLGRCVFVGDAGMASVTTLAGGGGRYLVGTRLRAGDEVTTDVLTRPGHYRTVRDNLQVKEVCVPRPEAGERRRRYIVCYNTQEAARQAAHRARAVKLLEGELAALAHAGSAHPRRACELLTSLRFRQLDRVKVAALPTPHGRLVQTSELAPETRNLLNRLQIPPPPTILETSWGASPCLVQTA